MVNSIEFPLDGNGYVYSHPEEPAEPTRYRFEKWAGMERKFDKEGYDAAMAEYKKEHRKWARRKNEFVLPCYKNLAGKKFVFEPGKVNVIFGPNAAGKTTILKAIAGEALCADGFTALGEPTYLGGWDDDRFTQEHVKNYIEKQKVNSATVDWDGTPIYYENMQMSTQNCFGFGDLQGTGFINSIVDEIEYIMGRNKISAGQKMFYIFNKVFNFAKDPRSMEELLAKYTKERGANSLWKRCWKAQIDYFSKKPGYSQKVPPTIIFDEPDKSFDIPTVWKLYSEVFPTITEKLGCQIITVSHNPLILSKEIVENPIYNIVPVDEDYLTETKELLSKITF